MFDSYFSPCDDSFNVSHCASFLWDTFYLPFPFCSLGMFPDVFLHDFHHFAHRSLAIPFSTFSIAPHMVSFWVRLFSAVIVLRFRSCPSAVFLALSFEVTCRYIFFVVPVACILPHLVLWRLYLFRACVVEFAFCAFVLRFCYLYRCLYLPTRCLPISNFVCLPPLHYIEFRAIDVISLRGQGFPYDDSF